jgi:purine nucleoside permease
MNNKTLNQRYKEETITDLRVTIAIKMMRTRQIPWLLVAMLLVTAPSAARTRPGPARPIAVKVVVVAMFEVGADTGDAPGELQHWVERDHLDRIYPLAAGYHAVRMNGEGELVVLTGQGTAHAAATIMALGLDPRFDLSRAYWVVAGIAGASADRASLASAVWARRVVDGDLAYEIDAREIPPEWTTGYVPLRKTRPFEEPAAPLDGQVFTLNESLAEWAFQLTRATPLADSEHLKEIRSRFDGEAANKPPFVTMGDELSSSTYWHGKLFDAWAAEWVRYFTGGKGEFSTTAMEDAGTLQSLQFLAQAGRVDLRRVLVLRTVSNYDRQPHGITAAESLGSQRAGSSGAFLPAIESAYTVGHVVVKELLTHWAQYAETIAGADAGVRREP